MRTTHELLILLKGSTKKYMRDYELWGLCAVVSHLLEYNIITFDEFFVLNDYISQYRPIYKHNLYYGWKEGRVNPRLRWLKKQIRKTK